MRQRIPTAMVFSAALFTLLTDVQARTSLDAVQADGYGKAELKRPTPNVLTVIADIDGHKMRLIVDTGWGEDGISLSADSASGFHLPLEEVKESGASFTGKHFAMKRAKAGKTLIGNVELAGVPIYFGNFGALHNAQMLRKVGADGFLGSGFLQACSAFVDLQNLQLYLKPPGQGRRAMVGNALRAAGLAEVSFEQNGHNIFAGVSINGVNGFMLIDTGAELAIADTRFAARINARAYSSHTGFLDAAGEISRTQVARIDSFKIGGFSVRAPDLRFQDIPFYAQTNHKLIGAIGMDILGSNGTIIDFGAHKLYFYPAQ